MVKKNKKRRRKKSKSQQAVKRNDSSITSISSKEIDLDQNHTFMTMTRPVNIQVSTPYTIPKNIYYYDEAKDFLHLSLETTFADKLSEYHNYSEDWCYWNYT